MQKRTNFSPIATSIEQSKRLLAAGIDPKSADMCYIEEIITNGIGCVPYKYAWSEYPCVDTHEVYEGPELVSLPAWSLSRLWDLLSGTILGGWFSVGSSKSEDIIEELVRMMEQRHANDDTPSKVLLK